MDFSWSDEQLEFKRAATTFAKEELNADVVDRETRGEFSRENWLKCAKFGVQGLPFPEQYGGGAADILTTLLTMEGLGLGCKDSGLVFSLNAQMWSVQMPIANFGTDEQKARYLPALCGGTLIGAHGMSEPDSGSDAYSLRTRADAVPGGYVLNGVKTLVTNAPIADVAVVFATVDKSKKMWGVTGFIVDVGTPGFSLGSHFGKMGLRTSPIGELVFTDCFVPESSRLGPIGAGASIFADSMEWERSCILAGQIGVMERQLEAAVQYARDRKQFGQRIGKFQSVANRIVDMKVRLETGRLLLYNVAWKRSLGKSAVMESAIAKLYLSEIFVESSLDAIRTHGGYGYTTECGVERDLRDSVGGTLYSGTSDIQRNIIARFLGL